MVLFRRFLIWVRNEWVKDTRRFLIRYGLALFAMAVVDILVDRFVPFGGPGGVYTILRSLLLVITGGLLFLVAYGVSLHYHFKQTAENPEWVPFRGRFSPMWRRRISIVFGAFLLVIIVGAQQGPGYTLASSVVGAGALAIIAFLRMSPEEQEREKFDIPDPRDLRWESEKARLKRAQHEAKKKG